MRQIGVDVDEAARAVLDGTPTDWDTLETTADGETLGLIEQLRVLSALADVHRGDRQAPPSGEWGHLQLRERVGAGSGGEVYRAWDPRLAREVALKLIPAAPAPADGASPLIEEGRLLARVRHANVVTIYGAEQIDHRIGLWMEFVDGQTLEALLRAGHQFSRHDVVQIGLELCGAVSAVHAAGLLHRDIKAQNVMRASDGRIVLMDFGTGREQSAPDSSASGTPLYLAPEVFAGGAATTRSDVYSVGVLLFRLLTGAYPVSAASIDALRDAHARGERTALESRRPDLPPVLARIVARAIDADPARRYATCDELAADLRRLARRPRSRTLIAAGLAAALVASGWIAWNLGGRTNSVDPQRPASSTIASAAAAAALVPPISERPIIAVVPFRNNSPEPDGGLLVEGLTYELIRSLSIIDGLDVRSATSSFAFKDTNVTLADISRQLGVNLILEGAVMGSPGQWRVHATLAAAGDTPIWSQKFESRGRGLLAVQDEIALAVVNHLRLKLGQGQRRYEIDPEVSQQYLRARALIARRGTPNAEAAVHLFEDVIAREPGFAPAYAGLAEAYSYLSQDLPDVGGLPPDRAIALMRPVAQQALAIDPLLAEAHAAMGILHAREHHWAEADASFRQAIARNPTLTQTYTSYSLTTLLPLGKANEAIALLSEAQRRDPLSLEVQREIGMQMLNSGNYAGAIDMLQRVRRVDPSFTYVDLLLARALSLAGRLDEAMPIWETRRTEAGWQHWMAYAYVRAGRRAEIEQIAATHKNPYRLLFFYTALGDRDRALTALEQATREAPHRVVRVLQYPELASLRGDPRFAKVREFFNLR